jgi:Tfp pilus assembly pilus retraction ATPase PilT
LEDPIEFVFEEKKSLINQRDVGKNTLSWTR